jgi:hypothetical protein
MSVKKTVKSECVELKCVDDTIFSKSYGIYTLPERAKKKEKTHLPKLGFLGREAPGRKRLQPVYPLHCYRNTVYLGVKYFLTVARTMVCGVKNGTCCRLI